MAYEWDISGNLIYIGESYPGASDKIQAVWRIRKLTWDGNGNITDKQYASGSSNFDQVWNNRASVSYN
jgi:hypothetical protein